MEKSSTSKWPLRSQDSRDFREAALPRLHVAEPEGDGDDVERRVRKRELHSVRLNQIRNALAAGRAQHRQAEIRTDHRSLRARLFEREREIAGTRGQVEHIDRLPRADDRRGPATPPEVEPAAEKVVGQIVATRDGAKKAPDRRAFSLCGTGAGCGCQNSHGRRHIKCFP